LNLLIRDTTPKRDLLTSVIGPRVILQPDDVWKWLTTLGTW